MITIGVEEEYLLLDPVSGLPVSRAEKVRAVAGVQPALSADEVHPELLQVQVEVATPVCESLEEVGGHLLRMRHALGAAAEEAGCRLVACAAAPFAPTTPAPITDTPRYRALYTGAPRLVDEQLICGMHVHVAIPGRAAGVAVLNRLRPWLPVLVAMSANSPLWGGTDTGFASWRTVVFGRWPVSGPPPLFAGADDYDRRIQALLDTGVIRDTGQLFVSPERGAWSYRQMRREVGPILDGGESVVIFPQGGILGIEIDFLGGPFALARALGRPILPVVLTGSHRVWEHPYTPRLRYGQPISLRVLPPIPAHVVARRPVDELRRAVMHQLKQAALSGTVAPPRRFVPARDGYWDGYAYTIDPAFPSLASDIARRRASVSLVIDS